MTGFKNSLSDVGYQHADILAYVSAGGEIVAGVLLVLGLFTPVAAAGALAFLINGLLATISAKPHSHTFSFFLPDGHEYQITLIVLAVAVILCRSGPLRPRRRPGLGTSALHRVVRGAARRHRRRYRRMGAAQRRQSDRLMPESDRYRYGLGTRPELASVSCGSVAKVTAGNRSSAPLLSRARAQEPR